MSTHPLRKRNYELFARYVADGYEPPKAWKRTVHNATAADCTKSSAAMMQYPEVLARIEFLKSPASDPANPISEEPPEDLDEFCKDLWRQYREPANAMRDRLKAGELLAKLRGWFAPDMKQIDVNLHAADLVRRLDAAAEEVELLPPSPDGADADAEE